MASKTSKKPTIWDVMGRLSMPPQGKADGKYTSDDYQAALAMSGTRRRGDNLKNSKSRFELRPDQEQFQRDLKNPLYIEQAKRLGITKFNTANDMARVISSLANPAKPSAPAPQKEEKKVDPTTNEATEKLRMVVEEQVKQNEDNQKVYQGMMNDITARLVAAEQAQTKVNPSNGLSVEVGAPGESQVGTTPEVTTTTTKPIARRKKPGLEIESAPATGASLAI